MSAWCPWTAADKDILKQVQRRAVNMISGLSGRTRTETGEQKNIYRHAANVQHYPWF